jgi:hypothetical protein
MCKVRDVLRLSTACISDYQLDLPFSRRNSASKEPQITFGLVLTRRAAPARSSDERLKSTQVELGCLSRKRSARTQHSAAAAAEKATGRLEDNPAPFGER